MKAERCSRAGCACCGNGRACHGMFESGWPQTWPGACSNTPCRVESKRQLMKSWPPNRRTLVERLQICCVRMASQPPTCCGLGCNHGETGAHGAANRYMNNCSGTEFGNKVVGFDEPTQAPCSEEQRRQWQSANRTWWESTPMR